MAAFTRWSRSRDVIQRLWSGAQNLLANDSRDDDGAGFAELRILDKDLLPNATDAPHLFLRMHVRCGWCRDQAAQCLPDWVAVCAESHRPATEWRAGLSVAKRPPSRALSHGLEDTSHTAIRHIPPETADLRGCSARIALRFAAVAPRMRCERLLLRRVRIASVSVRPCRAR
jgi:hypothetical protein